MRSVLAIVSLLLVVANGLMISRLWLESVPVADLHPRFHYWLSLQMNVDLHGKPVRIRTFLPKNSPTQVLSLEKAQSGQLNYSLALDRENRVATWTGDGITGHEIAIYQTRVDVRARRFELPSGAPVPTSYPARVLRYLQPSDTIQSRSDEIQSLRDRVLDPSRTHDLPETIAALYRYVSEEIKASEYENSLDAITTLKWKEAFCGGKARLLAALMRSAHVPARLVGGLILTSGSKRTSHVWVEAWVNGHWVPFDALNHHYAEQPANYLVLYYGDEPLFTRTQNVNFRYLFHVKKWRTYPDEALQESPGLFSTYTFWSAFRRVQISLDLLRVILLLPVGVLVVVIFRNIVGLQTFGTFHPALIAVAFRDTGLGWGLMLYTLILSSGLGLRCLFDRIQLLHTPRLAIVLLFVIACILGVSFVSVETQVLEPARVSMFPIAILAITIESFFSKSIELGSRVAFWILVQTTLVVVAVFCVMESYLIQAIVFSFPEVLLAVAALYLLAGRWVGLRMFEFYRFRNLLSS